MFIVLAKTINFINMKRSELGNKISELRKEKSLIALFMWLPVMILQLILLYKIKINLLRNGDLIT